MFILPSLAFLQCESVCSHDISSSYKLYNISHADLDHFRLPCGGLGTNISNHLVLGVGAKRIWHERNLRLEWCARPFCGLLVLHRRHSIYSVYDLRR